jgi:integrase
MPVFKRKCQRCKNRCNHREVWYYAFSIRGVRYRKSVPEARTKAQAKDAESQAREEIRQGKYGKEPSNITLKEFIEMHYLPWSRSEKRSWRSDESRIKSLLVFFKNKKMREISSFNVMAYKKHRLATKTAWDKPISPASVNRELQLLRRIFNMAIEDGKLQRNPCKGIIEKEDNIIPRFLTVEEEAQLKPFLVGRSKPLLDILTIDLHTGMRKSELLSLHKGQIDFLRNWIVLTHTKNGKPRTVPIHPEIRPILQRLCDNAGPSGYLFENPKTGKPRKDIKTAWRSALEDAGIPHIPFHCAGRHTFGTRAAEGGASLKDIQEIMDHADINTTMRYVHATDPGKRRAVEAAARVGKVESLASHLPHKKTATG